MTKGKIIMLPMPIGIKSTVQMNTVEYLAIVKSTKCWVAENARTLRRFISSLKLGIDIESLNIFELGKNPDTPELIKFLKTKIAGENIAVVSEAGLPGMADPGAEVAKWAHANNIKVESFTGPGSVYLALCASGLNGQHFTFHGYCPVKEPDLIRFLSEISRSAKNGYSQVFIETPYRNDRLFGLLKKHLPREIGLCIARGLQDEDEWICTRTIGQWANEEITIGKTPAVFIVGVL